MTDQGTGTSYEQSNLPFGNPLNAESSRTDFSRRFTSYERSPRSSLDYAQNRTYDSRQGRFTQVDPLGMGDAQLDSPQSLNLYTYCQNDPINNTDPTGLGFFSFLKKLFKWVVTAIAVIVAVVAVVAAIYMTGGALGLAFAAGTALGGAGAATGLLGVIAAWSVAALDIKHAISSIDSHFAHRTDAEHSSVRISLLAVAYHNIGSSFARSGPKEIFESLKRTLEILKSAIFTKCHELVFAAINVLASCIENYNDPECVRAILDVLRPLGNCLEEHGFRPFGWAINKAADAYEAIEKVLNPVDQIPTLPTPGTPQTGIPGPGQGRIPSKVRKPGWIGGSPPKLPRRGLPAKREPKKLKPGT